MGIDAQPVLNFVPSALEASQVGTWLSDVGNNRTVGDATTARLFGIDPEQLASGVPFCTLMNRVHFEDRESVADKAITVRSQGGLFIMEHRVCPNATDVRWVLARGRYERNPATGLIIGQGIVIDITESRSDWQINETTSFIALNEYEPSLDNVAALVIKARDELLEVGDHTRSDILPAMDLLLWKIGRALAREQIAKARRSN